MLKLPVTIAPDMEFGIYPLSVSGTAGTKTLATYTDQVRLCRGRAIEFLGNSWIEAKYLKGSAGGSPSITFGNNWTYEFDLTDSNEVVLKILLGSHGAKWSLSISKDEKTYEILVLASSWPHWREVKIPSNYLENMERPALRL